MLKGLNSVHVMSQPGLFSNKKNRFFLQSNMPVEIMYIGYKQIQQNMSLNLIF